MRKLEDSIDYFAIETKDCCEQILNNGTLDSINPHLNVLEWLKHI